MKKSFLRVNFCDAGFKTVNEYFGEEYRRCFRLNALSLEKLIFIIIFMGLLFDS